MYNARPVVVENVSVIPKTAARIAAALLILGVGPTYFSKLDVTRLKPQTKAFAEPEVFAQAQKGSLTVVLTSYGTYNYQTDVTRLKPQAKVFSEPEPFIQPQRSTLQVLMSGPGSDIFISQDNFGWGPDPEVFAQQRRGTLIVLTPATYVPGTDVTRLKPQAKTFSDPEAFAHYQRSTQVVINGRTVVPVGADVFIGSDTFGWGSFDPETFPQAQRGSLLVLAVPVPVVGSDVFIGQDTMGWTFTPETFTQVQRGSLPVVLNIPYSPTKDVTRLKAQTKYFTDPEIFFKTAAPFNALVINGKAGAIPVLRVQAVAAGWYAEIWRDIGDVFDIKASDFSDSSVSFIPPTDPAYPVFGWMKVVASTTPLYSYALANQGASTLIYSTPYKPFPQAPAIFSIRRTII